MDELLNGYIYININTEDETYKIVNSHKNEE